MRRVALLLLLVAPAAAQTPLLPLGWKAVSSKEFGGLNLIASPTSIGGDAADAQNVLTDAGYLEKRPGNVLLTTILAGLGTTYVNEFNAANGTRYLIAQASTTIYQTNLGGTPVAISTIAAGNTINTVPAFSKLYFADGNRQMWSWDDVSTATVYDPIGGSSAPICTYLDTKDTRVYCGNIPNESTSRVRVSSTGAAYYWTQPPNFATVDNAPTIFDVNPDDGDQINCLKTTPWGVFVAKRYSSYMIKGTGNLTYELRVVDPKIGCVDNRSVQMVYGVLKWLAVDGVYGFDGAGPPRLISWDIDPLVKKIRQGGFGQSQFLTQLNADWNQGTQSTTTANLPPTPWNLLNPSGGAFPSSATFLDNNGFPPISGLPAFASDTLVNVDTISFGGITGFAQLGQNVSPGVAVSTTFAVWASSWAAGNFTTGPSTWTLYTGGISVNTTNNKYWLYPTASGHGNDQNTIYTMAQTGFTFGHWQFGYAYYQASSAQSQCSSAGTGATCLQFDITESAGPGGSSYFGVQLVQPSAAQENPKTINIVEFKNGQTNVLASSSTYIFTSLEHGNVQGGCLNAGCTFNSTSTYIFDITKTPTGLITVYVNGSSVTTANTSNSDIPTVVSASLMLNSVSIGASIDGQNFVSTVTFSQYGSSGSIVSRIFDSSQTSPVAGVLQATYTVHSDGADGIAFYVRSSTSPNNDLWTAFTASSNSVLATVLNTRYWQVEAIFGTSVSSETPTLYSFLFNGMSTGTYYSPVQFIGTNISSWRQFSVSLSSSPDYTWAVRAATFSFISTATTPSWTAQTPNQTITIATGSYAQWEMISYSTSGADNASVINLVSMRFVTGSAIPLASATLDRRYYLCVAISTSVTAPDICLVQQKNGKWVKWVGPLVGAMGIYNYQMIAADGGNSGKVWQIMQPGVFTDDGAAIDGFWITGDYTDGVVFNTKILHELWVDATPVQVSSLTVSYQLDDLRTYTDYTFSLDNGNGLDPKNLFPVQAEIGAINKYIPLASGTALAKYLTVKFEDANVNSYFRVNNWLMYVEDEARTVP